MPTMNRLDRLRARRVDTFEKSAVLNEVYDRMRETSTTVRYAIGAMQPIDPEYTANTFKESERVRNQLEKNLGNYGISCEFDHQGSVTNDTHIKAHSDIDLLTLHTAFVTLDPPQRPAYPSQWYQGDPLIDLIDLRHASEKILRDRFPEAYVETSGSKAITIAGGSLRRRVDVIASNWCDTCDYAVTKQKRDRAINILDLHKRDRIRNLPFLHNDRINAKDQWTMGGLRKAIRLVKSVKYDSTTQVDVSSYDIAAIIYAMDGSLLTVSHETELLLVERSKNHLDRLIADQGYRESLSVPNGTRRIFGDGGASMKGLMQLRGEIGQLHYEIENDLNRSFRKLAEARIEYS